MITWNAALILVHLRKRELEGLNAVQAILGKSSLFEGQKGFFCALLEMVDFTFASTKVPREQRYLMAKMY